MWVTKHKDLEPPKYNANTVADSFSRLSQLSVIELRHPIKLVKLASITRITNPVSIIVDDACIFDEQSEHIDLRFNQHQHN